MLKPFNWIFTSSFFFFFGLSQCCSFPQSVHVCPQNKTEFFSTNFTKKNKSVPPQYQGQRLEECAHTCFQLALILEDLSTVSCTPYSLSHNLSHNLHLQALIEHLTDERKKQMVLPQQTNYLLVRLPWCVIYIQNNFIAKQIYWLYLYP